MKVACLLSRKKDGNMKIGNSADARVNRFTFFKKNNIDPKKVISAIGVHGKKVAIVKDITTLKINGVDAIITKNEGIFLSITVADCLPVYIYDKNKTFVGIIHAGWRGVEKNIIEATINKVKKNFKIKVSDIRAVIGPHIRKCHFTVGEDVEKKFSVYPDALKNNKKKQSVDLSKVAVIQLCNTGILRKNIKISQVCTYCNKEYFSYRRDLSKKAQTMIAMIGLKK